MEEKQIASRGRQGKGNPPLPLVGETSRPQEHFKINTHLETC